MKKTAFILMAEICLMFNYKAQLDTLPAEKVRYEMGMNLAAVTLRGGDFYSNYTRVLDNQVFSGLYLKWYKGKNAIRAEINYSQRNAYYGKYALPVFGISTSTLKSVEIKAGYQRFFGRKQLRPYFFTDLEYNYYWPVYNPVNFLSSYYDNYYHSYLVAGSFYFISPGIGLRWRVKKHLVLNFETGAQFFYSIEKGNYYNAAGIHSIGINAKPARFSIGFIF